MKTGSGLLILDTDYSNKSISIDFSGKRGYQCYRNDASILFFVANSYRESIYILLDEMNKRYIDKLDDRRIGHLILPLLFNFRHFIEVELKAIYAAVTKTAPLMNHDIKRLFTYVEKAVHECLSEHSNDSLDQQELNYKKEKIIKELVELKRYVEQYTNSEPFAEYYRYLFGKGNKDLTLKEPVITIEYYETRDLISNTVKNFDGLVRDLNKMNVNLLYFL